MESRTLTRRTTGAGLLDDEVRVAVQDVTQNRHAMQKIEKQNPLVNIVKDLCLGWGIKNAEDYQLQFDDTKVSPPPIYITEENRTRMSHGDILKLDYSPQKMSKIIAEDLEKGNISQNHAERLAFLSADITFVEHFVTGSGFIALNKFITSRPSQGQLALNGHALAAFVNIMNHSIVSWDTITHDLLTSVIWHIEERHKTDLLVIKSALSIIKSAILNSALGKSLAAESKIEVKEFISTLKTRNAEIQVSCISLINTIMSVSSVEAQQAIRKCLLVQPIRQIVWENIFTGPIDDAMNFQLYSLQTRLVNLLSNRLHGAIMTTDPAALKEVNDLRRIAFDDETENLQKCAANDSRDFTRLGFKNPTEPLMEFQQSPPGALTLDCMAFFAHQYTQQYRQVVLENSRERADEQDCPFAQASVELTQILSDILKIGVAPSEEPGQDDRTYYPMFFYKEKPFEECFCVCIQRLTKTWKEMKASLSDFNKVLMVVKEQITRALQAQPHTFDSMKNKLTFWSFAKIQEARQKELEAQEEQKRQAKPILELRDMIRPELEDVIKQQRLNRMVDGCRFKAVKAAKGAKNEKYLYCKLSHNAKVLHYGNSSIDVGVPETPESINVLDIVNVTGVDDARNKPKVIVITKQGGDELQLTTDAQAEYEVWLDGLNALTGNSPVVSEQAKRDLDELLSREVKLRLLDAEGIDFPDEPPPIPDPPSNFNFVTA